MICVTFVATPLWSGDWPQILGPERNGIAKDECLATNWPANGPQLLWKHAVGSGYAGPAVSRNRVLIFHRLQNHECIEALDRKSGQPIWKTTFKANYEGGVDPDIGPRCVPLIFQDSVYVFGAAGQMHCVELESGKRQWSRDLHTDFRAKEGYFGAGSSPIIVQGRILINVGGRHNSGIVALDLNSGQTIWQSSDCEASYSSPVVMKLDERQRVVFVTRLNTVILDPHTGTVLQQWPFGKRGPTVNAASPLIFDNKLFISASYGVGALLAEFAHDDFKVVWQNDQVLSSQYNTSIYQNGYLYGIHGREDIGHADLRCVEAKTGQVAWNVTAFGVAHLILAEDLLLAMKADGDLELIQASPSQFTQLASAQIFKTSSRALPALANGRLLARNSNGEQSTLKCFHVGALNR